MMGDGEDDDCADPDDMDSCDELAESACCSFGDSSACRENDELLAFLSKSQYTLVGYLRGDLFRLPPLQGSRSKMAPTRCVFRS